MSKKRVKLTDIARELNISVGTVSLVLSGKAKQNRIGDEMVKKVLVKVKEMGYQANIMARSLRTGKSGIIGLAVADIANPYFGRMARYIENEASKLGYQVMFGSSDEDSDKLLSIINIFSSRQVEGLIVVPVENCEIDTGISDNSNIPTVLVDRECDNLQTDLVCTDNFEGATQLNRLLVRKGYKKIAAFVYNLRLSNFTERINGYKEVLKNAGENLDPLVFHIDFKNVELELRKALEEALRSDCDALFFVNNSLGILSLKILREMDAKLLTKLGMVSFDNPEVFDFSTPRITCWEQPVEEMSKKAVGMLVAKINNKSEGKYQQLRLQGKLIRRDSQ